jgi:hypothetical protein
MSAEPLAFRYFKSPGPSQAKRFREGSWSDFSRAKVQWMRRLVDYFDDDDVPWVVSRCDGKGLTLGGVGSAHLDRGSFAATSDSLIFIPKTRKPEEAKSLGRRYLVRNITDMREGESGFSFSYEGDVVEIKCPQVFWQLALRFPQIVSGSVVVQPEEIRLASETGSVKKLEVGCLVSTAVGASEGFEAKGSASYARYMYDVVLRAKSNTPYYQKLPSHQCRDIGGVVGLGHGMNVSHDLANRASHRSPPTRSGTELWVRVTRGQPTLHRLTLDVRSMYDPETVVVAWASVGNASVSFPRHKILSWGAPAGNVAAPSPGQAKLPPRVSAQVVSAAWANCAICGTRNEPIPASGRTCSSCGARMKVMMCSRCGKGSSVCTKSPPGTSVSYRCVGCQEPMATSAV